MNGGCEVQLSAWQSPSTPPAAAPRTTPRSYGNTPRRDLGTFLKAPKETAWKASREDKPAAFAAATIHSVKGREYTSVVVVLPKDLLTDKTKRHVIDHWEGGVASELRRVLYVAASRAQRLLILAVHSDHLGRVAKLLKDDEVPYELILSRIS
jgi:superfamily I DNA/RNA helicase